VPDFYRGQWDQARVAFDQGVTLSRQAEAANAVMYTLLWRGWLRLWTEEGAAATEDLEEELALVERSGDLNLVRGVQRYLADRDLCAGRPSAAYARLAPLLDRPGLEELDVTRFLPQLAWAHLDLGEVPAAVAVAEQAVRRARSQSLRLTQVDALRVQALVELRQGHTDETVQALEEGLALARSLPYPFAEARLLHVYGQMHLCHGAPGLARPYLDEAQAICQRLGAHTDSRWMEQAGSTT
jgi:tetratricopeptide (TPR) repeat protein